MNTNSYDTNENEVVKVRPLLSYHFTQLLKGTNRKIQKPPNLSNPWKVKSTTNLHATVYLKWFRAVRDFRVQTFRNIVITKTKKGEVKEITITFTRVGPFCYHLGRAVNEPVKDCFMKKIPCANME